MRDIDRCFEAKGGELEQLYKEGFSVGRGHFSDVVHFYAPGMVHFESTFHVAKNPLRFPAVSVTGTKCQLQCEHCKGRLLEEMIPATTPKRLFEVCAEVKASGGGGVLISGGSIQDGSVPLDEFLQTIGRIKREIGLDVVVHTGLVHADVAQALAAADIDAAMIDVIGSDETFRSVYHVNGGLASLERTMGTFEKAGVEYVPHIVVGLDNGVIKGERKAVELISVHRPAAVVVVALMPLEHTPMENVTPPTPEDVSRVILAIRLEMQNTPLLLGCARPRGEAKSQLDILAVNSGVNGIAYPSEEGFEHAVSKGLKPQIHDECCALMYRHIRGRGE